MITCS